MKLVRLGLSGVLGIAVTFALLMLMYTLIASDPDAELPKDVEILANIWQAEEEIEEHFKKFNIKKPEPKNPPPPRMAQQEAKVDNIVMSVQLEAPSLDSGLAIGGVNFGGNAGGRPLKRVAAKYPPRALDRGLEGTCTVEFRVDINGKVCDPVVLEGTLTRDGREDRATTIWNLSALRAARQMKFKPQMEDNKPIEFITTYKFIFQLDKE